MVSYTTPISEEIELQSRDWAYFIYLFDILAFTDLFFFKLKIMFFGFCNLHLNRLPFSNGFMKEAESKLIFFLFDHNVGFNT
jgi:hypothetical protein